MRNTKSSLLALAAVILLGGNVVQAQQTEPVKLLSLPFSDPKVIMVHGPLYHPSINNGRHDTFWDSGIAFDYATTSVAPEDWEAFEVVAAASGYAMQTCSGPVSYEDQVNAFTNKVGLNELCHDGFGRFVIIRHDTDIDGLPLNRGPLYTLYAHLNDVSDKLPFLRRTSNPKDGWVRVERGEYLGMAGFTGFQGCAAGREVCTHLHFEVYESEVGYQKVGPIGIDPYVISTDTNLKDRDSYPPNSGIFPGCGAGYIWRECPPFSGTLNQIASTITFEGIVTDVLSQDLIHSGAPAFVTNAIEAIEIGDPVYGRLAFAVDGISSAGQNRNYGGYGNLFEIDRTLQDYELRISIGGLTWSTDETYDLVIADNNDYGILGNDGFLDTFFISERYEFYTRTPVRFPLDFGKVSDNSANDIFVGFNQKLFDDGTPPDLVNTEELPTINGNLNFQSNLGGYDESGNMVGIQAFGGISSYSNDLNQFYGIDFDIDLDSIEINWE